MEFSHIPVLFKETIELLDINPEGIYVDGTAGGAGHSEAILKKLKGGRLISIDQDPDAIKVVKERLSKYDNSIVVESNFSKIDEVLKNLNIDKVDGVLLDIGVSSYQFDEGNRGFSYNKDAKLDMRMSQKGLSAYDIVNTFDIKEIEKILREYGEEKFYKKIAQKIVEARNVHNIETTFELVDIIKSALPAAVKRESGHPAKKTFQALRIAVNDELNNLSLGLDKAFESLKVGGVLAVITFHSLEDRIVKQRMASWCKGCTCPPDFPICVCGNTPRGKLKNKKPIEASLEELSVNHRSRSAKLRGCIKLK